MKTILVWVHVILSLFFAQMPTRSAAAAAVRTEQIPVTTTPPEKEPNGALSDDNTECIPRSFDAPFGSYPNLLKITKDERDSFSPVVFFPEKIAGGFNNFKNNNDNDNDNDNNNNIVESIPIKDHRRTSGELASFEDIERKRNQKRRNYQHRELFRKLLEMVGLVIPSRTLHGEDRPFSECWGIGKYDENRDGGMYESDLFDDLDNTIDGYGGRRTVHLGMDLGGPVGTPVHAFCDGIVHSIGYNPELGDYGHVIVVEHFWEDQNGNDDSSGSNRSSNSSSSKKRCWALYGHLDESILTAASTESDNNNDKINRWRNFLTPNRRQRTKTMVKPGDFVKKGQVIGRMGDIEENGGWIHSHLHFQLSTKPPDQPHDMPGASSVPDRMEALQQYPDPRYVLGPMY